MIIPGLDQSAVSGYLSQWYRDRKTERLVKERIWDECWKAYDCKFGETWADLEDYRSKRYLSLPWQAVETITASIVNGCMPSPDWANLLGRTPGDDAGAKMMWSLLKWQHYKSNFRTEFKDGIVKPACIFGNVPYCVDWHEELITIPDPEAYAAQMAHNSLLESQGMTVPEEMKVNQLPTKQVRSYDGPRIQGGNIFDFVIDLNPSNKKHALRAMRFFRTKAYLMNMAQEDGNGYSLYQNVENLSDQMNLQESSDSLRLQTERQIGLAKIPPNMVELIQYEGDIEIKSGDNVTLYPNHIAVVANRTTLIRFEPNPFYHGKPTWDLFVLFPEPNETYGRGIVEPILGINDGIQCRYNQVIENNTLIANSAFKYKDDGVFDPDQFTSAPGALIAVADPQNNLLPLVTPDKASLSWEEINFGINQFNLITGASENFGNDASATQVAIQNSMSADRRKEMLNHFNYSMLIPTLEKEIALNQQLMDEPMWIRVVSDAPGIINDPVTGIPSPIQPQQMQVSPEDIAGDFDIMAVGADVTSRNTQQAQNLLQLTTTIAQSPFAGVIKGPEFVNEIYRLGGFYDAYKFIKSPEEIQLEQQQQLANQLAVQQAGMGSPNGGGAAPGPGGPSKTGPAPGPRGAASVAGQPEGPGELPAGPNPAQLAGNRLD